MSDGSKHHEVVCNVARAVTSRAIMGVMASRFGRYETIRPIASGGMATVHLARSVGEGGFERLVAIKVMHPHIAADADFRGMFLDEARLAARIRHPNVVGVIDVQNSEEGMFLVMDFVDGPTLHQLRRGFTKRDGTIPIEVVLRMFIDTLTGLEAAHRLVGADGATLNLVHRDVSPHNILVGKDGVTRITDFGVARAEARITSTRGGELKGKIAYMASEQVHNREIDERADIYGVGVALWEALTGRRLFKADNEAGLIQLILTGADRSPAQVNPHVPLPISELCMRALRIDRAQRPRTAGIFADELEEAAARAGVRVSSQRQVAAFISGLDPGIVPESTFADAPDADPMDTAPTVASGSHRSNIAGTETPAWEASVEQSGITNASTEARAMVTQTQHVPRSSSRWPLALLAAGAACVVAWLVWPAAPTGASAPAATVAPAEAGDAKPAPEAAPTPGPDPASEPRPTGDASSVAAPSSTAATSARPPVRRVPRRHVPAPKPTAAPVAQPDPVPAPPPNPRYLPTDL